jgi:lipocalin
MMQKDYPVLLRFTANAQLVLDVKYKNGFYFEHYVVLRQQKEYMHELYSSIFKSNAERYFENLA